MLRPVLRAVAVALGILLSSYPAYRNVVDWLTTRRRFPQYAEPAWRVFVELGVLYGAVVLGVVLYVRHVRRVDPPQGLRGRDAFTGGLQASVVLFVVGFLGPFVYGWVTRTEVGNVAPILGVIWGSMGFVLAIGAALMTYGCSRGVSVQNAGGADS